MDWINTAVSIEEEGEKFYRELSEQAESEGLKRIFTMLADDEVEHKKRFIAMRENVFPVELDSDIKKEAQQIFKSSTQEQLQSEQKHLEVYKKALDIEQKSIDFYRDNLESVSGPSHSRALEQIIKEEEFHYKMIETIVVMVERPDSWVEHAEFGVRDEY